MAKINWRPGNMLYPVPAVMVSCQRENEKPNIITVAWAGTTNSAPVMLSISVRPERYSYNIIKETGEFVVNLVTKDLVRATDFCGVRSGRDVDKFAEMGLHVQTSSVVKAPGIAESPVNIECRVVSEQNLGSHVMFLAEVVNVSVDDSLMNEKGGFELNSAGLVAYSHGEYFELGKKLGRFGFSVQKKPTGESDKKPASGLKGTPAKAKKAPAKAKKAPDKKEPTSINKASVKTKGGSAKLTNKK